MQKRQRRDELTAQRVEVAIVFLKMLGAEDAARYMAENGIPAAVAARILDPQAVQRQGDYLEVSKGDPRPEPQAASATVLALPVAQAASAKHAAWPALQLVAAMGAQLPVHLPQVSSGPICPARALP